MIDLTHSHIYFSAFFDKPRSLVPWPQIVTPYTETIKVEQGKMILLQFTYFAILVCGGTEACSCDHISVTDGHMTPLLDKACGFSTRAPSAHNFFQPTRIKSTSHIVNIFFSTDGSYSHAGWSLSWSVVTPGLETTRVLVCSMLFSEFTWNTTHNDAGNFLKIWIWMFSFMIVNIQSAFMLLLTVMVMVKVAAFNDFHCHGYGHSGGGGEISGARGWP